MKNRAIAILMALAACAANGAAAGFGAAEGTVNAAWFKTDITPPMGTPIAGYGANDVTRAAVDPLYAIGLCLDDGETKAMLVSFDLLGMDAPTIRELRKGCADILGIGEERVMFTCTHTHGGPHTRRQKPKAGTTVPYEFRIDDNPEGLDVPYLKELRKRLYAAVRKMADEGAWQTCRVGYYSAQADENRNRRFTTVDNCASFTAHRRSLLKLGTGYADKELGTIVLFGAKGATRSEPVFVIGNYAAHPLASHCPGLGGHRIGADYPGHFRRYVEHETGAAAMFVTGAAGDLIPKGDELGDAAARKVGENLAMETIAGIIDVQRNQARFVLARPKIGASISKMETKLNSRYAKQYGQESVGLEIQCLSIGDVALVGVPGELVCELGAEIKWHSPFRRTFIAYCATDYCGYISTANQVAAGGYEPQAQKFTCRDTLRLVTTARDALFELRERMFPEESEERDRYPDNMRLPLVNLPGGVKGDRYGK